MARAHPGLDSLTKYLRTEFPWKKDWFCEVLDTTFTYTEVKEAIRRLKNVSPKLHLLLSYRWMAVDRSRNDIANGLYMDSSTLKRKWDKAMNVVVNWLVHGIQDDLIEALDPIDLIQYD